jgi:hypothetical protein
MEEEDHMFYNILWNLFNGLEMKNTVFLFKTDPCEIRPCSLWIISDTKIDIAFKISRP